MSNLNAFLSSNAGKVQEVEYEVSKRFKGEDGKIVPFILAPIDGDRDEKLKSECTVQTIDKKTGRPDVTFDSVAYGRKMTVVTIKEPNLNSKELQDSYGVMSAEELITKMLLPGEYSALQKRVQEVNGFKTYGDLEEEAKNE